MATTYKRLGATVVVADTDTALYTLAQSSGLSAVVSSIIVCNIGSTERTFRIAVIDDDDVANVANEDYIYYDIPIGANDTFIATVGLTIDDGSNGAVIMVRANHAEVVFSAFGSEIS